MTGLNNQWTIKFCRILSYLFLIFSVFYSVLSTFCKEKTLCLISAVISLVAGILYYLFLKTKQNEEKTKENELIIEATHPRYS